MKRYLIRHLFKIKLLSKAAFLFLILILFKANKTVSVVLPQAMTLTVPNVGVCSLIYNVLGWPTLNCCLSDLARNTWCSSGAGSDDDSMLSLGHLDPVKCWHKSKQLSHDRGLSRLGLGQTQSFQQSKTEL